MRPDDDSQLFATELKVFSERLDAWLVQDIGRFVLIKEYDVHGPFDTEDDAYNVGYELYENDPFMVRVISPAVKIVRFTRDATNTPKRDLWRGTQRRSD